MKLEINLDDREEIEAAHALLATILSATTEGTARAFTQNEATAAVIFGGAAALAPLPPAAPFTAGVDPLPTAPGVAPVASSIPTPPPVPAAPAPMPAPVAVAPLAPAAPSTPANGVELDSKGLPWDERIHAGTKSKVTSGEWKKKKGLNDPALIARVEAELRARVAVSAGGSVSNVQQTGDTVMATYTPTQDPAAVFGGAAAPVPFAPPAAPSLPAAPAAPSAFADPTTFEQLMSMISPLVVSNKLPPTATNQAATANGLANIVALQTAPQFVPLVWATVKQMYPAAFV